MHAIRLLQNDKKNSDFAEQRACANARTSCAERARATANGGGDASRLTATAPRAIFVTT